MSPYKLLCVRPLANGLVVLLNYTNNIATEQIADGIPSQVKSFFFFRLSQWRTVCGLFISKAPARQRSRVAPANPD